MSATRTFSVLKASAIVVGHKFGYQTGEKLRQATDISMYFGVQAPLGGSQRLGLTTGAATWVPVEAYLEHVLNGDSLGGLTLEAVVYYYTANAATTVQVRVRNTTDSSNAALGTASTSTTIVKETLTLTLASGDKTYRLEVLGDASNEVYAWGVLRIRKVPS